MDAAAAGLGLTGPELELALRRLLDAFRRALGRPGIEPWDYLHTVGAAHRLIDPLLTTERMLEINAAHLASLGADAAALGIRYDVEPRAGRPAVPVAFTLAIDVAGRTADGDWRAATPWVFASYAEGALGNLVELLHESGHALHYAAIRTRPAFFEPLAFISWA